MLSTVTVINPAKSQALLTVNEAKLALNLTKSTDITVSDQLQMFINWSSDEISAYAGRVFGRETVSETFRNIDSSIEATGRIYLSRWPVFVDSSHPFTVMENDVEVSNEAYTLNKFAGSVSRIDGTWTSPVTVDYTGGYDLPNGGPQALKRAVILMTREAYYDAQRGDASVRMVSHKSSRIIYFDPNKAAGATAAVGGNPTSRAVMDLVKHFIRFPV